MPIIKHGYSLRPNKDSYKRASQRRQILSSQDICSICGLPASKDDPLEVDHITPISEGGSDELWNLRVVHRSYNRSRGGAGVCRTYVRPPG